MIGYSITNLQQGFIVALVRFRRRRRARLSTLPCAYIAQALFYKGLLSFWVIHMLPYLLYIDIKSQRVYTVHVQRLAL